MFLMMIEVPDAFARFRGIPNEVLWTLICLLATLIVSSLAVRLIERSRKDRPLTEVRLRIRTWWVISVLAATSIVLSKPSAIAFLAFVSFLALKEFLSLIPTRRADRRVLFWAYLSIPFQYWWVYTGWYGMFIVFIPIYMFLLIPTRMVTIGQTDGFLRAAGTIHWALMTTVFSLSHAAYLIVLKPVEGSRFAAVWPSEECQNSPGTGLLLFLVILTQLNDVCQFLWGKTLGRRKAVPSVSPGKTIEGLVGGVVSTVVLSWLIGPQLTFIDGPRSLLGGLIIGIGGFAGDVSISAIKRDIGVKDSGSILPGHGGILDRVDSLTYTAPLFFHFVWYCYC